MDIYWSPAFPSIDAYAEQNLLYRTPDPLTSSLANDSPALSDPTVRQALHNVYVVRSPVNANLVIRNGQFAPADDKSRGTSELFTPIGPMRAGFFRFRLAQQILFFSTQGLSVSITGAHYHLTEIQSKTVFTPRTFDLSRVLFPIEISFEFLPSATQFQFREGDPLYYIRFMTDQPIRLRRFRLTNDIIDSIRGCMSYQRYRPQSSLEGLYDAFIDSESRERVLKLIQANMLDDGESK
ncbi:MAG TPA: hypothetical protein PK402_08705 [Tepidisphaeraceae bacterium]|nr:hypothetical protein [Tepidisphaeraceae bacterium]